MLVLTLFKMQLLKICINDYMQIIEKLFIYLEFRKKLINS